MPSFIRYAYHRAYLNALRSGASTEAAQARANLRISSPQSFLYLVVFLNIKGVGTLLTADNRYFLLVALLAFFFGNRILVTFLLRKLHISGEYSESSSRAVTEQAPPFYEYLYWAYQAMPIVLLLASIWWNFYR